MFAGGIIPEEKLSNPPYEFGEFFSRIGSNEQYARFEFWDSNYELVRDEMIPIDFLKMPFPVLFADFAYIEEKDIVVYGDHVIDLSEKIITIDDRLPDKCTFIEKRVFYYDFVIVLGL